MQVKAEASWEIVDMLLRLVLAVTSLGCFLSPLPAEAQSGRALNSSCSQPLQPGQFPLAMQQSAGGGSPSNQGIKPPGFVSLQDGTLVVHGIDVSKYQDAVDFKSVYDCGGRFAYVRLSGGENRDNELLYRTHWANVRNARLLPGPYHNFSLPAQATSRFRDIPPARLREALPTLVQLISDSARAQARLFSERLQEVRSLDGIGPTDPRKFLPAALDLSYTYSLPNNPDIRQQFADLYSGAVCAFLDELAKTSYGSEPVVLFTSLQSYATYFANAKCDLNKIRLWIRHRPVDGGSYENGPDAQIASAICNVASASRCVLDQYTSFGGFAIFRVGAPLDLNRFHGSEADLNNFLIGG